MPTAPKIKVAKWEVKEKLDSGANQYSWFETKKAAAAYINRTIAKPYIKSMMIYPTPQPKPYPTIRRK